MALLERMLTNDYKDWLSRYVCVKFHSYSWIDSDDREETINAILEERDPDPSWYCPKCDKKYSKSIYEKKTTNYTNDSGPR